MYNERGELGDARYKEHLIYFLALVWLKCPVSIWKKGGRPVTGFVNGN